MKPFYATFFEFKSVWSKIKDSPKKVSVEKNYDFIWVSFNYSKDSHLKYWIFKRHKSKLHLQKNKVHNWLERFEVDMEPFGLSLLLVSRQKSSSLLCSLIQAVHTTEKLKRYCPSQMTFNLQLHTDHYTLMVNKLSTAMNYSVPLCLNITIDKWFTVTWLIGNLEVTTVHFMVVLIKSHSLFLI